MKSLVTVQNLYKRGKIFKSGAEKRGALEIAGIEERRITLGGEDFDMAMADTLSRLTLLYDVPFSYLVPDEKMLPEESLRFFELDALWLKSLLDGALSVGRNTKYDYEHDAELIDTVYRCAVKNNMQVRKNLSAVKRSEKFEQDYRAVSEQVESDTVYSGFLLRSSLVQDFEGLEVEGVGTIRGVEKQLLIARFDKLSQEVLLCLFCGRLKRLLLKQPPEAVHLGFRSDGRKALRSRKDGRLLAQREASAEIWAHEEDRRRGVIRYNRLAENMRRAMEKVDGEEGWRPDSSDLALQLIQNALTGEFTLDGG